MMIRDFFKFNAQTSPQPLALEFERASGIYLYDKNNKPYIDLISGIAVSNVGHANPYVADSIKQQVEKHMHLMVYGEYVQAPQVKFAKKLIETTQHDFDQVYFLNSGAEAVDASLKLAQKFTKRKKIVACQNAYHGSTLALMALMDKEYYRKGCDTILDVAFLAINDTTGIDNIINEEVAAVIVEPIQGESGVNVLNKKFLEALRRCCDKNGCLLIFDEIQTGIGRTGNWWAYQNTNTVPDILVSGKALGGGMPLSAFMAKESIMSTLKDNPILGHMTTFGGHPICCAAGLAAFEYLEKGKRIEAIQSKEELFLQLLVHPKIVEVRSRGLMMAVEFGDKQFNFEMVNRCISLGVLTDWFLHCDTALRIAPPLTISETEITQSCGLILEAIEYATKQV